MKYLIALTFAMACLLAWAGYAKYQPDAVAHSETQEGTMIDVATTSRRFACDGRQYCSQMRSCAEATFFLRNCPGVKMDGDNDGIPCERQWCQ